VDIRHVGDQECISCGECIDVCPTKAITWKGSKIFLKANEGAPEKRKKLQRVTRILSAVVMLAVLVGAIAFYWIDSPDAAVQGAEIGNKCYSAQLEIVDETGFTSGTIDPANTGKVTVVNFWGTWCTPCVNELPYFDQIAAEYGDEIAVVAIHSKLSAKETEVEYISKHYPDSQLIFAWDSGGDDPLSGLYYPALGGSGAYPYTLVLNERGIITHIRVDALTYEDLKSMVEEAMA